MRCGAADVRIRRTVPRGLAALVAASILQGCASYLPQQPEFNTTWLLPSAAGAAAGNEPHQLSSPASTVAESSRTGFRTMVKQPSAQTEPSACTAFDREDTSKYIGLPDAQLAVLKARRNDASMH